MATFRRSDEECAQQAQVVAGAVDLRDPQWRDHLAVDVAAVLRGVVIVPLPDDHPVAVQLAAAPGDRDHTPTLAPHPARDAAEAVAGEAIDPHAVEEVRRTLHAVWRGGLDDAGPPTDIDARALLGRLDHARTAAPEAEGASGDLAEKELSDALQIVRTASTELRRTNPRDSGPDDLDRAAQLIIKWRPSAVAARSPRGDGATERADAGDHAPAATPSAAPAGGDLTRWSARHFTREEAENEPPGWSTGWNVLGEVGNDPDPLVRVCYVLAVDQAHDGDGGDCSAWLARNVAATLDAFDASLSAPRREQPASSVPVDGDRSADVITAARAAPAGPPAHETVGGDA